MERPWVALLCIGLCAGFFGGSAVAADPPPEGAVVIEPDLVLPTMPAGAGPEIPVCIDGSDGTLVAGCDSVTGSAGPEGPKGDPGEPGNLGLADSICPEGQFLSGFDDAGGLVCSPSPEDCSAIPGYGETCVVGVGACQRYGAMICNETGGELVCSSTEGDPTSESCNGIDDDCDGVVDEDFPGLGSPCQVGVGACEASGTMICGEIGGELVCSGTEGDPTSESCNGIDDDCDGVVDESLTGQLCSEQDGVCASSTKQCGGSLGYLACTFAEYGPSYEPVEISCDGLDNNCDGDTDNTLFSPPCVLQDGVCAGSLKPCTGPGGWDTCGGPEYGPDYQQTETLCDYLDNDCNGQVDEGFDLSNDTSNCGYCGFTCDTPPNSSSLCEFGSCGFSCDSGWYNCDYQSSNGCESAAPCE